jgi:hypothetical protein
MGDQGYRCALKYSLWVVFDCKNHLCLVYGTFSGSHTAVERTLRWAYLRVWFVSDLAVVSSFCYSSCSYRRLLWIELCTRAWVRSLETTRWRPGHSLNWALAPYLAWVLVRPNDCSCCNLGFSLVWDLLETWLIKPHSCVDIQLTLLVVVCCVSRPNAHRHLGSHDQ